QPGPPIGECLPLVSPERVSRFAFKSIGSMKSLTAVVGLVLLVGGFTYYHARSHDTSGLRLSGVVAANEVIIAAKIDGRIQRLLVNEGSWVKRDDVIAQLERDEIEPERQRQQAAVQQQEARLSQGREQLHLDRERVR